MAEQEKTASEKLVESVTLTLFSRVAMILATGLILPIALWLGARAVSTIDDISKKIDAMREASIEQSADIRALRVESVEQQRTLSDHEARVHVLEAAGRANPPMARP